MRFPNADELRTERREPVPIGVAALTDCDSGFGATSAADTVVDGLDDAIDALSALTL